MEQIDTAFAYAEQFWSGSQSLKVVKLQEKKVYSWWIQFHYLYCGMSDKISDKKRGTNKLKWRKEELSYHLVFKEQLTPIKKGINLLYEEIKRMKQEMLRLQEENEILKKAMTIFARK